MAGSIATRRGDDGTTGLLYGQRVAKDHPQVEAVGAFDELNVELGAVRLITADEATKTFLIGLQNTLVALMGELACAESDAERYADSTFAKVTEAHLALLDATIADLEGRGLSFAGWATPGATPLAVAWDRARVAARRAERRIAALPAAGRRLRPVTLHWTNRLSDVLWLMARAAENGPG